MTRAFADRGTPCHREAHVLCAKAIPNALDGPVVLVSFVAQPPAQSLQRDAIST